MKNVPENEFLSIFFIDGMVGKEIISQYNEIKGLRKIANPYYSSDLSSINEYEELLVMNLASGTGPDIILFDGFISPKTLAESGYFADMDKIINSHPDFNMKDYNTDVLNSVLIDGNRYYIPLNYYVNYQISTTAKFEQFGLDIPDTLNIDSFIKLAEGFFNAADSNQSMGYTHLMNDVSNAIMSKGEISKDIETEKNFSLFKEEFNRTKFKTGIAIDPSEYSSFYDYKIDNFFDEDYLFLSGDCLANPEMLYDTLVKFEKRMQQENSTDHMLLFTDMLNPNSTIKGYTLVNIAINADSCLKNEAFHFVEFMLSENIQSKEYIFTGLAPVNNAAYNSLKQSAMEKAESDGKTEMLKKITDIIESAEIFEDALSYSNIIYGNKEFQKYLDGDATFEEMADSVNHDIQKQNQNDRN